MTIKFQCYIAAAIILNNQAFAACEGPDAGEASTVLIIPANESVNVFHYRERALASVIEFCVRETGSEWKLVASRGTEQSEWSLLQSWTYPKTVQIKTRAYANNEGALYPFKSHTRTKTPYGYSFSWFDNDSTNQNDQIIYCYSRAAGCPASRRVDFPEFRMDFR
jgi:hypothetical protein